MGMETWPLPSQVEQKHADLAAGIEEDVEVVQYEPELAAAASDFRTVRAPRPPLPNAGLHGVHTRPVPREVNQWISRLT